MKFEFDRERSRECADIPAGTAVRFEPGDEREVKLVPLAGSCQVYGFNCRINGSLEESAVIVMDRRAYAETFGPTVGDRVRLADTELFIEVEQTTLPTVMKSNGGGKVIRDMGQSPISNADGAVDVVITNALIPRLVGYRQSGYRKDGRIFKLGKAGIHIQDNVDIIIGPGTEVVAGEGMILTAGGIDSHIHFICPQQIETAIASGITTMIGGGTGPHGYECHHLQPGP